MQHRPLILALGLLLLASVGCATKLDDYVNKPDSAYSWEDLQVSMRGDGWTGYALNMTSQRWLSPDDWGHNARPDDRNNIWWHKMIFIVPDSYNRSRSSKGASPAGMLVLVVMG